MKKIFKFVIIIAVFALLDITFFTQSVNAEGTNNDILTITASGTKTAVTVSGTTGTDVVAIVVEIFNSGNKLITMQTFPVKEAKYNATIAFSNLSSGTYTAYVVNYNGVGTSKETTFNVKSSTNSGGSSSSGSSSSGATIDVKPATGNTTSTGVLKGEDGSWYFFKDGVVDENYDDVAHNENGWWVVRDGKVDFSYQGIASKENGDWYCEKGKVNFNANGVLQSTAEESSGWYFVKDGKVQKGKETVEHNANGWWYIGKDGKVDFNMNTVAQNVNGWWMIQKGKVNFDYKGVASNQYGTWYLEGGKVNFNYNGKYTDANGKQYTIKNGQVIN